MATRKWLPTDLTSVTVEGAYRLKDPNGVVANGADVLSGGAPGNWTDRSGKARTLIIEGSGQAYSASAFGTGSPAVTTNGSGGWRTAAGMAYPANLPLGASVVMQESADDSDSRVVSLITPNGSDPYDSAGVIPVCLIPGPGVVSYWYGFNQAQTSFSTGTPVLIDGVPTSLTTYKSAVNAVDGGTSSHDNLSKYQMDRLGLMSTGQGGNYVKGAIAEMVLWSGIISADDLTKLQGYLAWNNGQQSLLPAGHAYKTAAPTVTTGGAATVRRRPLILMAS